MAKALSSACLVVLICAGGWAWASKPKIAILGLEAAPGPSGAVDPATTRVAREITQELRQRAQADASPYTVAPNSSKELTDEKLLGSCDNEALSCMAVIGAGLAADMLLYGRVERKGKIYQVSLNLLDVEAKTTRAGGDEVPVDGSIAAMAKRLYDKLIGGSPSGGSTLIVQARSQAGVAVQAGTVMIDEEVKGDLASGTLTVTGIAEGCHVVAIEAGGYQRFEETVTFHGGEPASLDALLLDKAKAAPASSPPSTTLWKVSLGAGIAAAVAGAGLSLYSNDRVNAHLVDTIINVTGEENASIGSGDCGKEKAAIIAASMPRVSDFDYPTFDRACTWKTRIYIGFAVGAIGVVGAVTSLIMLSRDTESSERSPTVARGQKPNVAIVPILTPDGAGASFSMTW
jgi:hypothetical protein